MAHSHQPVEVDPKQLDEARTMWNRFAFGVKWVVIAHVVGLLFLAWLLL